MENGWITADLPDIHSIRKNFSGKFTLLPNHLKSISNEATYPVNISSQLREITVF